MEKPYRIFLLFIIGTSCHLSSASAKNEIINMVDIDRHIYIPIERFLNTTVQSPIWPVMIALTISPMSSKFSQLSGWESIKRLIDKILKHVCARARFSDIRELLVRNILCNEQLQHYLSTLVTN